MQQFKFATGRGSASTAKALEAFKHFVGDRGEIVYLLQRKDLGTVQLDVGEIPRPIWNKWVSHGWVRRLDNERFAVEMHTEELE